MTENRRIAVNVLSTYGRSLYALVIGLFTGRWVIAALGHQDYGLYGLVGGLTFFLTFLSNLSAAAVSRFYAYEVGRATKASRYEDGIVECRKWFNTALFIHTILPIACICIGYPVGLWAIRNWLEIPIDRVAACVWVFRFACISCLVSMMTVPFKAMYVAKQYIAELTIYGVVESTFQAGFLYYIASHPSDWLVRYSAWTCFVMVVPQLVICARALAIFDECKPCLCFLWNVDRIRQISSYAGWQFFGGMGGLLRGQGIAILVNKYFGARVNASMSIANTVNGQAGSLSAAMQGAFTPAIVHACGAGNDDRMRGLAYRACKFGIIMTLVFVLPLSLEIKNVMVLWLKNPPPYAAGLCLCMLILLVIEKSTVGHMCAVNAKGRVAMYQFVLGGFLILTLPVAWLLVWLGFGVYSVGFAFLALSAISALGRAWFARAIAGLSIRYWLFHIVMPLAIVAFLVSVICAPLQIFVQPSFARLCLTTLVSLLLFLPMVFWGTLTRDERNYAINCIAKIAGLGRKG